MNEVTYQGRKASRQGSEQRRLAILEAALRIVVRDGVRGVRHRAVAAEADVPLSATTYYFKDINDLLADAFTLFVEKTIRTFVDPFWSRANIWLQDLPRDTRHYPALIQQVVEHMSDMATAHILMRVREHRDHLVVEHAFWYAALADERLHDIALQHSTQQLNYFIQVLEYVGANEVELAARALNATARRLEYEGMLDPGSASETYVRAAIHHQIRAVLSV